MSRKSQAESKRRLVFLGSGQFAVPILKALAKRDWLSLLVITEPAQKAGRGLKRRLSAVAQAAKNLDLPFQTPANAETLQKDLTGFRPDLLILADYGHILPSDVLKAPKLGALNFHPSLLSRFRGASPIQAALLAGELQTGVSLIAMTEKVDQGPILAQRSLKIKKKEETPALRMRLSELAAKMATEAIPAYLAGRLHPTPQNKKEATMTYRLTKEDGLIELHWPAAKIERHIRAMKPWPGSFLFLDGKRLIIEEGKIENGRFQISRLKIAGGRTMSLAAFSHGYPTLAQKLEKLFR